MFRFPYSSILLVLGIAGGIVFATSPARAGEIESAVAVLHPTEGNEVKGVLHFKVEDGKVRVTGEVTGLPPGKHGFHIHQYGDCSAPNGKSAGGHFNPTGHPHAGPEEPMRHVGDLGNIVADDSGTATVDVVSEMMAFEGGSSILGRGVIVHAGVDDLKTQPTGDAGGRVACGVIGVANPGK